MYQLNRVERAFILLLSATSFLYLIYHLVQTGYLPPPFFYDKSDSFMDYFNVLFWADNSGRYSEWKSIYLPFSFVLAKLPTLFSLEPIHSDSLWLRENFYPNLLFFLVIVSLVCIYFQSKIKNDWVLLLSLFCSSPFLFSVERGNLIIFTYLFLLLSVYCYRNFLLFSVFLAFAISLKVYLIALLFIPLLNAHLSRILFTLLFFVLINVISGLLLGEGDWLLFVENIFNFSGEPRLYEWGSFSFSYLNMRPSLSQLVNVINLLVLLFSFILFSLVSIRYLQSNQVLKAENKGTLYLLLLMLIMIVVKNAGGYVFILLFPFLRELIVNRFALYLFIAMMLPFELPLMTLDTVLVNVFSTSQEVVLTKDLTTGMFIRPIAFLLSYIIVSYVFLMKRQRTVLIREENLVA